jgi:hypothetical protein
VTNCLKLLFWVSSIIGALLTPLHEQSGIDSQLCGTESRFDFISYPTEDRQKTNFQNTMVLVKSNDGGSPK